jgi:hypothetical protein
MSGHLTNSFHIILIALLIAFFISFIEIIIRIINLIKNKKITVDPVQEWVKYELGYDNFYNIEWGEYIENSLKTKRLEFCKHGFVFNSSYEFDKKIFTYACKQDKLRIGKMKIRGIFYSYRHGRFTSAFIVGYGINDFKILKTAISGKFKKSDIGNTDNVNTGDYYCNTMNHIDRYEYYNHTSKVICHFINKNDLFVIEIMPLKSIEEIIKNRKELLRQIGIEYW